MKNIFRKISSIIYFLLILGLVCVAFLNFNPRINLFNKLKFRALVVKSGSMEPVIKTGSLVLAKRMETYQPGEIITFQDPVAQKELITHRLVRFEEKDGQEIIVTKGDANKTEDQKELRFDHVIGKVLFTIPYLGYLVHYSRQPMGIVVLVAVPAFLIILIEVLKIIEEIRKTGKKKKAGKLGKGLTAMMVLFTSLISLSALLISETQAKFFDQEKTAVKISVGIWDEPKLSCHFSSELNDFLFEVEDFGNDFCRITYGLTYLSEEISQEIGGESQLEKAYFARGIFLGTCSDEDCSPHQEITDLSLDVLLEDLEGREFQTQCKVGI